MKESKIFQGRSAHFFQKQTPPQNSRHQKGDMKQPQYRGSKNITCHCTKFSHPGHLACKVWELLLCRCWGQVSNECTICQLHLLQSFIRTLMILPKSAEYLCVGKKRECTKKCVRAVLWAGWPLQPTHQQSHIFILVINQLDAQNFCFTISLCHASGIITPIGVMIPDAV